MAAKIKRTLLWALLAVALCLMLCGIVYYVSLHISRTLSRMIGILSLSELRAWAMLATLALPIVAVAAFLFGRREARVLTDGLAMGVKEVSKAADEVTTLKGKLADRMRQPPVTVQVAAGSLPSPPVHHRRLEGGQNETVDL